MNTAMRGLMAVLAVLLLDGCVPNNVRGDAAIFDLGPVAGPWQGPGVRGIGVSAPSWLATAAMQYRFNHDDPARRRSYAESRWAAPPAELIEQALRRRAVAARGDGGAPIECRLRVDLDEFVQAFDSAQASRTALAVRASLVARGGQVVARRGFALDRPAPSADARGGVAAAIAVVDALTGELSGWLAAEKSALATRCQG